ncbi:MAG TPA: PIN domain-containing protein [Candidatus Manganitrophaceae bacterium]|nr:PIN domain-containing protein [Candidatus Manganitrophaceae bacterium]
MRPLLLDTSYLIALEVADDQNHLAAAEHWGKLTKSLPPLITTSYVFDEIVTFFNNRNHHSKAVEIGNTLLRSPSVELIHIDPPLLHEGWRYLQKHRDKTYSLTDCISFVVMKQRGIKTALTFDKHFKQAGFGTLP